MPESAGDGGSVAAGSVAGSVGERGSGAAGSVASTSGPREVVEQCDVAIVGAGPAGATAARLLAEAGAGVVVLEARALPRPKLCGGGLTMKAQRLLPPRALATAARRVERVSIEAPGLAGFELGLADAPILMVERAPFDLALVGAAAAAGADVRDGQRVEDVLERPDGVEIRLAGSRLRAACLVVADGEPSRLARRLDLGGHPRRAALGLEVDLPHPPGRSRETILLDYRIDAGYAWSFPKGDHANIGVMSARAGAGATLRGDLTAFIRDLGLDPAAGRVQGHWIPLGLGGGPLARGRALLVGDAAGTADPLYGEGIAYAIASAHVAAGVILDWADGRTPDLAPYDGRLRGVLGPPFARLALVARTFAAARRVSLLTLRHSRWARREAIRSLTGSAAPFALRVAEAPGETTRLAPSDS